jgi:hypothetical protein
MLAGSASAGTVLASKAPVTAAHLGSIGVSAGRGPVRWGRGNSTPQPPTESQQLPGLSTASGTCSCADALRSGSHPAPSTRFDPYRSFRF